MNVVVLIGNSDDKLTQAEWGAYVSEVSYLVELACRRVHFSGGSVCWESWQNACFVGELEGRFEEHLRVGLERVRKEYRQDSVALIVSEVEFI